MKLTFRTVSGSTFNLEIEPEKTIGDLKQAVVVEKNIELSSLKLVYKSESMHALLFNANLTLLTSFQGQGPL